MLIKSRLVITLIVLLITLIAATAKAQASQNAQIILNLQNGQQHFGVPHIYQGDNGSFPIGPTNQWPVYYGLNNASQYWSQGNINSNQPVLELVPGLGAGGAMFWSETYSGGSVTITIQATKHYSTCGWYAFSGIPLLEADDVGHKPTVQLLNTIMNHIHRQLEVMLFRPRAPHRTSWFSGAHPGSSRDIRKVVLLGSGMFWIVNNPSGQPP